MDQYKLKKATTLVRFNFDSEIAAIWNGVQLLRRVSSTPSQFVEGLPGKFPTRNRITALIYQTLIGFASISWDFVLSQNLLSQTKFVEGSGGT